MLLGIAPVNFCDVCWAEITPASIPPENCERIHNWRKNSVSLEKKGQSSIHGLLYWPHMRPLPTSVHGRTVTRTWVNFFQRPENFVRLIFTGRCWLQIVSRSNSCNLYLHVHNLWVSLTSISEVYFVFFCLGLFARAKLFFLRTIQSLPIGRKVLTYNLI